MWSGGKIVKCGSTLNKHLTATIFEMGPYANPTKSQKSYICENISTLRCLLRVPAHLTIFPPDHT